MEGVRCINVVVPCRRYEKTLAFYREVLGLAVLNEGPAHCFFRAGGVNLALHPATEATGGGIYLDFAVASHSAAKAVLLERDLPIEGEWEDGNGKFLKVRDPEGNVLELIEYR